MSLEKYREVKQRISLADSLIRRSQLQIKLLTEKSDQQALRIEGLQKINTIQSEQNKELRNQNIELLKELDNATERKWFKRPELYFVAGAIIGVIATR